MDTKPKCTDPELGRLVFRWAMSRSGIDPTPSDKTLSEHLTSCAHCRAVVSEWKAKAVAGRVLAEAERVVAGNLLPGEHVERRVGSSGVVLFKYLSGDPDSGVLITLDAAGRISSIRVDSRRSEFEHGQP